MPIKVNFGALMGAKYWNCTDIKIRIKRIVCAMGGVAFGLEEKFQTKKVRFLANQPWAGWQFFHAAPLSPSDKFTWWERKHCPTRKREIYLLPRKCPAAVSTPKSPIITDGFAPVRCSFNFQVGLGSSHVVTAEPQTMTGRKARKCERLRIEGARCRGDCYSSSGG